MQPEWQYEPAKDLDETLVERLRRFPREPDLTVYLLRSVAAVGLRLYLRLFHRFSVRGEEHLPEEASFVLVANHASHLDALCLISLLPMKKLHRVFPVAAKDYFYSTAPRTVLSATFINSIPFGRYSNTRHSLRLCREVLSNAGNIIILFPEGTRTKTGEMGEFKPGVGFLVAGTNIPVVPCFIEGAFSAFPKGCLLPRPSKIRITIGDARSYEAKSQGKEAAEDIADDLRVAIENLALEGKK